EPQLLRVLSRIRIPPQRVFGPASCPALAAREPGADKSASGPAAGVELPRRVDSDRRALLGLSVSNTGVLRCRADPLPRVGGDCGGSGVISSHRTVEATNRDRADRRYLQSSTRSRGPV